MRYHAAGTSPSAPQSGAIGLANLIVGSVRAMKKHSHQEILLKLEQAAELARVGKTQTEVCKALGVSVMTFHRWRKLPIVAKAKEKAPAMASEQLSNAIPPNAAEMARHLEELTTENRRLRKIVTDLLLEKMQLEESTAEVLPTIKSPKAIAGGV